MQQYASVKGNHVYSSLRSKYTNMISPQSNSIYLLLLLCLLIQLVHSLFYIFRAHTGHLLLRLLTGFHHLVSCIYVLNGIHTLSIEKGKIILVFTKQTQHTQYRAQLYLRDIFFIIT